MDGWMGGWMDGWVDGIDRQRECYTSEIRHLIICVCVWYCHTSVLTPHFQQLSAGQEGLLHYQLEVEKQGNMSLVSW